jgi:hypothetical protein
VIRKRKSPPLFLTFGLHAHQPVGNFGNVFEDHFRDVYEPFLKRAVEASFLPLTLHISGPLLDWLEANRPGYLDLVGRLVSFGHVELLLAGYYEPILPSLSREDRVEQIQWMQEALRSRFGVQARGLWLTERVWEPDLPADLAEAGVEYVLVDDRHFVAAGFDSKQLHHPFRTEFNGGCIGVFPIHEELRYMIPFKPPEDTAAYLRDVRAAGGRVAVAADDIEKFGGWPGTKKWVYERGWLEKFFLAMRELEDRGEIRLATFSQALDELPSAGLAYLPSCSYREMEEWSLSPEGYHRLEALKNEVGEECFARGESPLIRGSHWRNFLVKYPESNRMHKKMNALSKLCRERGNPEDARRALGRAQCNDAYWHGVFGGLYLRHIRDTVWRNLSEAEGRLRAGESMAWERTDLDLDGHVEILIHSGSFSAQVSPARGGAVEELTIFRHGVNLANILTRRREAYHEVYGGEGEEGRAQEQAAEGQESQENGGDGTPSIHDLEEGLRLSELPPVDQDDRVLFVERVLPGDLTLEDFSKGRYEAIRSWAKEELDVLGVEEIPSEGDGSEGGLEISLGSSFGDSGSLEKRLRFLADGTVEVFYQWEVGDSPSDAFFTTEISLGSPAVVRTAPMADFWRFPISTFSKSERGFDETVQGESVTVRWPMGQGWGRLRLTVE